LSGFENTKTLTIMLNSDELTDNIDAYLSGTMSEEDKKSFELACKEQPHIKEQLEIQRVVRNSMKKSAKNATKQLFKQWHQEMQETSEETPTIALPTHTVSRTNSFRLYRWAAIAASVTVLLVTGIFVFQENDDNSFADAKSVIKVEYVEQNVESYGFADSETKGSDYKYIMLLPTQTYDKPHYEFIHRDTLVLFSNELKPEKDKFKIVYDGQKNSYELNINGKSHNVEFGFKGVKPLQ